MRYGRDRFVEHCTAPPPSRGLHIEHLEPRCLLAGDTYLVNFQIDEATPVTRYLVDSGQIYGPAAAACLTVGPPTTPINRASGASTRTSVSTR